MAKKFGKFMLMSSIGAAVGAGIYYYMKGKKEVAPEDNFDADDFDDFDDDLDDDLDEAASIPIVQSTLTARRKKSVERLLRRLTRLRKLSEK